MSRETTSVTSSADASAQTTAQSGGSQGRERFASRLGFILISAGCAIGLGNVWRFPYIVGQYGGAAFVLIYLLFLVILGLPVMVMEFAVGRASQKSSALAVDVLQPNKRWHWFTWWGFIGCIILMMFYTVVGGWMLDYIFKMISGSFVGADSAAVAGVFADMLANPAEMVFWTLVVVAICYAIVGLGLQKGVERITKVMMVCLLAVMGVLAIRSVTLPGAQSGLEFYLLPDFSRLFAGDNLGAQMATFGDAVHAAMGQAFFTLSLGISAMEIFGSYIGKDRSLTGEAARICGLDTLVAFIAGLIIFPACAAFAVDPGQGPSLVFVTLPGVFNQMPLGQLWGALFFVFMSFAALSTIIAVFENLVGWSMDKWGTSRKASVRRVAIAIAILSLPCVFGYNIWSGAEIPGIGDIQSLEDFVISNNMLPIGSLIYVLFCVTHGGWGWKNFITEANTGEGLKFSTKMRGWVAYGVPALIVVILVMGYVPRVAVWLGLA